MATGKKANILYVLKVLEEYSDENHPLTQVRISELINSRYGLEVERKTIGSSLQILSEVGYDINKVDKKGFYLGDRIFYSSEITFLTDAIYSSKSLNDRQSRKLLEEIFSTLSLYDRKQYSMMHKTSGDISRTKNNEVIYNIEIISECIKKKKCVAFNLVTYDENGNEVLSWERYVSPYFLVNSDGKYYLVANYYRSEDLTNFRIDRMKNVHIREDRPRKELRDLKDVHSDFSITDYINDRVYMFGGPVVTARIEIEDHDKIRYIKDWFGERAILQKVGDKLYAQVKTEEQALCYWAMQYIEYFKVIEPPSAKEKIKELLSKGIEKYQ